jgi:hypothetical protein
MVASRNLQSLLLSSLVIALILFMSNVVLAQSSPHQYYGAEGGEITGYVLGVSKQPVDWAEIYASSDQHTYQAFSGMSGFYAMRVPAATYNVTVNVPGYEAYATKATVTSGSATVMNFNLNSINVTVSDGSSSVINFYLQQTQTPVPEFQLTLPLMLFTFTFAVIFIVRSTRHK